MRYKEQFYFNNIFFHQQVFLIQNITEFCSNFQQLVSIVDEEEQFDTLGANKSHLNIDI